MNSVLPPPLFKYRSYTYDTLVVAKFLAEPFTKQDIYDFRYEGRTKSKKGDIDYTEKLRKSLRVLERNGSIRKVSATQWQITQKGIQQIMDFAMRNAGRQKD